MSTCQRLVDCFRAFAGLNYPLPLSRFVVWFVVDKGGQFVGADMFKFLRAYRTGKLLGGELTQEVVEGKFNLDDKGTRRWSYGISESLVNGETVRGHQGGSRADMQMLWESDYTVIVLLNAIPPTVNTVSNEISAFITKQKLIRGKKSH